MLKGKVAVARAPEKWSRRKAFLLALDEHFPLFRAGIEALAPEFKQALVDGPWEPAEPLYRSTYVQFNPAELTDPPIATWEAALTRWAPAWVPHWLLIVAANTAAWHAEKLHEGLTWALPSAEIARDWMDWNDVPDQDDGSPGKFLHLDEILLPGDGEGPLAAMNFTFKYEGTWDMTAILMAFDEQTGAHREKLQALAAKSDIPAPHHNAETWRDIQGVAVRVAGRPWREVFASLEYAREDQMRANVTKAAKALDVDLRLVPSPGRTN